MALNINTNMPSLKAQKSLSRNQGALDKSLERLSSGLRLNSAKDDAAGMAISNRFTSQIRGIDQGIRNANDAISLLQTSEGAMQAVTSLLQRMREVAVQASNDTNSVSDRASLQAEMDQLYAEIDRIAGTTSFNGINLVDGSGGERSFQIGPNSGHTISATLKSVKSKDLNLNGYTRLGELNSGRVGNSIGAGLTINGVNIGDPTTESAKIAAEEINLKTGATGVSAIAYNTYKGTGGVSGIVKGVTINGATIADSGSMKDFVENINRDAPGVKATLNGNGSITLSNDTGEDIVIGVAGGGSINNSGFTAGTYKGFLSLTNEKNEAIRITAQGTAAALNAWGFNVSTGSTNVVGDVVTGVSLSQEDLLINGVDVGASKGSSAGDKAAAINSVTGKTGVKASSMTTDQYVLNFANVAGATALNTSINGTGVNLTGAQNLNDVVTAINSVVKGVVASASEGGKLVLTSVSGLDITVVDAGAFMGGAKTTTGTITLSSDTGVGITIAGNNVGRAGFAQQGGSDDALGSGLSVMTLINANRAIDRIDDAINKVSENRAELGAVQNRLDSTITNLQNVSENLSAANGRIMDTDFAKETAEMSKNQILMQAGVAMLAQAKQLPQQVMQLLQQ